jgi:alkaline phosphatase
MPRLGGDVANRFRLVLTDAAIVLGVLAVAGLMLSFFGGSDLSIGNLVLRAQHGSGHPLPRPPESALIAGRDFEKRLPPPEDRPRNVILFLGDGMGLGHVSAAEILLHGPGSTLTLSALETVGLMRTWAANDLITDSAASGTAIASGFKTDRKMVGVLPDGRPVRNLFEAARARGLATVVITTSGLVDATAASFTAHVADRDSHHIIFQQMLDSGTDVMIGGDWSRYRKARKNRDYQVMVADLKDLGSARGYQVVRDLEALRAATLPVLGLFPPRDVGPDAYGPPLETSLRRAHELVGRDPQGFIMVVESEITDEAGHDNDIAGVMEGMRELDAAVALALQLAAADEETLVIVTADHDTGTLALVDGEYDTGRAIVRWASGEHSAQSVPLFASGPGSTLFAGVLDNTDIGVRVAALLGLHGLPGLAESPQN